MQEFRDASICCETLHFVTFCCFVALTPVHARRKFCEKRLHLRSSEPLADDNLARGVDAVELKDVLGEIKTDNRGLHCESFPSSCSGRFLAHPAPRGAASTPSPVDAAPMARAFSAWQPSQRKSIRTSNAIEQLHEEFKRRIKTQTVLPCAETAAMLLWALLALGQITMRKVDGWQSLAEDQTIRSLTSPHDRIPSCRPKTRQRIQTPVAT
jgi:hypothetical protein